MKSDRRRNGEYTKAVNSRALNNTHIISVRALFLYLLVGGAHGSRTLEAPVGHRTTSRDNIRTNYRI